jgi:hypothetical protein
MKVPPGLERFAFYGETTSPRLPAPLSIPDGEGTTTFWVHQLVLRTALEALSSPLRIEERGWG